jgi:RNA polymerase sigma-70 factor (ECF subfamily)
MPAPHSHDRHELVQRLFIEQVVALKRFVLSLTPDLQLAEDVVQETFVELTKRAATFDPKTSFTAWMNDVARSKLTQLGWRANASGRPLREAVLEALAASRPVEDLVNARLRFIDDCIQLLAPKARKLVEFHYRNGLKPKEVATAMGWSGPSVHVALSRARAAIRECIEQKLAATDS